MNALFKLLDIQTGDFKAISSAAKRLGIPKERLKYYNDQNILPTGKDLRKILSSGIDEVGLSLAMGHASPAVIERYRDTFGVESANLIRPSSHRSGQLPPPDFETEQGRLFQMDCLEFLERIPDDSVDLVFADPPFNLNKLYPSLMNDSLMASEYLDWAKAWIYQCCRVLKYGGSLFLWNLPKWNLSLTGFLNMYLSFRHNISVDIKYSLPIQGRLYPSNYSLLYYCKGEKPNTFAPDRLPMPTCPHCYGDLRDYGGYKAKMNPSGVSLTDVWTDISPVRHKKYKKREGANELPLKLMDRIVEMASKEGDLVLDPFGGAGTTFVVAELKGRQWIGCELGPLQDIEERFANLDQDSEHLLRIRASVNALFTPPVREERVRIGLWTPESVRDPPTRIEEDDLFARAAQHEIRG